MFAWETASVHEITDQFRAAGITWTSVAKTLGRTRMHYRTTIARYCGQVHPKGPQSAVVKDMLAITEALITHLDVPHAPVDCLCTYYISDGSAGQMSPNGHHARQDPEA